MKNYLLTALSLLIAATSLCQYTYKTYSDVKTHFSFSIPSVWNINPSEDVSIYGVCVPTTQKEKEKYDFCFDGVVFYLELFNSSLDSTLIGQGYDKIGSDYFTSDKTSNNIKTFKINGKGWTGIYHHNNCGIICKDGNPHTGECDFLYFSNGKKTVCVQTVGAGFDKEVFDKLKSSFEFN